MPTALAAELLFGQVAQQPNRIRDQCVDPLGSGLLVVPGDAGLALVGVVMRAALGNSDLAGARDLTDIICRLEGRLGIPLFARNVRRVDLGSGRLRVARRPGPRTWPASPGDAPACAHRTPQANNPRSRHQFP
jgi:hypothetical protein